MSLNETLERLARERKEREMQKAWDLHNEANSQSELRDTLVATYTKEIFFSRMLKDINPGMSDPKIESMIDRSVKIAQMLADRIIKIKKPI